jgi:predicted permease
MILRDLVLRIRAVVAPRRVERELAEELSFHIDRETQKHIAAGVRPREARRRALARFGPVPLVADECRDARGIGFVDDMTRDIFYAFRTFRRAPLATLTVAATVALGLGLVTVVFTIYNFLMLRVDAVRNPGELFAVSLERSTGSGEDEGVPIAWRDYEAMQSETAVFTDIAAMVDGGAPNIDGRPARPVLVTGNFFRMLGVQASLGRPLVPEDDGRFAGTPVIVLSHTGWQKLFRSDPGVLGSRVMIGATPHEIVGVMPEGFRGLALAPPDYWAPLVKETSGSTDAAIEVIGRLKGGVSHEAAAAEFSRWATGRPEFKATAGDPIRVALIPRQGTLPHEGFGIVFSPLFFAFGLILMIGCANVANLLLARGVSRQREIGTRLALGASRRRIVRQLLTESLLIALVAAAAALGISRLFLEGVLYAVITTVPPEIGHIMTLLNVAAPTSDWRVVLFVVAGAIVSTVFFGLAPALQATRLDLVRTMRGEVMRDTRPSRARHALIAVQVGASALLLICAAIFLRGAFTAATRNPGIRTSDTLAVNIDDESQRAAVLQSLEADPSVFAIAAS